MGERVRVGHEPPQDRRVGAPRREDTPIGGEGDGVFRAREREGRDLRPVRHPPQGRHRIVAPRREDAPIGGEDGRGDLIRVREGRDLLPVRHPPEDHDIFESTARFLEPSELRVTTLQLGPLSTYIPSVECLWTLHQNQLRDLR